MTDLGLTQTHVGCLVATVVMGRSAKPFQREAERLIRNNGPEWTTSRMKSIWTAANHLRNGNTEKARAVYQDDGIAYHKSDLTPKGPFRDPVRRYVEAQRPSVIRRYAAVLRFYTTLVLPELSRKQSEKSLSSITGDSKAKPYALMTEDLYRFAGKWGKALAERGSKYGVTLSVSQVPPTVLTPNTYRYSRARLDREDRAVPLRSLAMSLLTEGFVPDGLEDTDPFPLLRRRVNSEGHMGRITAIQEQGCKARVVAMPSARLQYAFYPLHRYLNQLDSFLSSSVMKDQQKAVYGILAHMDQGKPCFSTDLSSATDRFPRSLSLNMLRGMGLDTYADALDTVSQGDWESPWGTVSYSVGQPMGLYSSFPLFHLLNQMVCEFAEREAKAIRPQSLGDMERFPNGKTFYVLGDDVVFSDSWTEQRYRKVMSDLGVPISENKSFSGDLTEFAGFVVTKAQGKTFAFRPYKPPSGDRVSNPIDFLAAMGTKARVINPVWAKRVEAFARTWSDRSPDLSPWVNQEKDLPVSHWDPAVLDNEFQLLSERYPSSVPVLTPGITYSSGEITDPSGGKFVLVRHSRDRSKDLPRISVETSREAFGQVPKHPKRRPTPIQADPLMRNAFEELLELAKANQQPDSEPSPSFQESPVKDSPVFQDRKAKFPLKSGGSYRTAKRTRRKATPSKGDDGLSL